MKKIDYYKLFSLYIKMDETTYVKKKTEKQFGQEITISALSTFSEILFA